MEVAAFHPLPKKEATRLCGPVPRLRVGREASAICGRALPGIPLCGARTFLSPGTNSGAATIWRASQRDYSAALSDSPTQRCARAEWCHRRCAEFERLRHDGNFALQRDRVIVAREAVKSRAVNARKSLESVERSSVLERFGVERHCDWRRIAAGAPARGFLGTGCVRRRIG